MKADGKTYKIGKVINPSDFNITCRGCRSKFNNFVRFCLTPDSMKWDCQNCSCDISMFATDINEHDQDTYGTFKIVVFKKKNGILDSKEYCLWHNSSFREMIETKKCSDVESAQRTEEIDSVVDEILNREVAHE